MPHLVAVVHRLRRVEPHRHRLGADRERADEDVEVFERGLQVHHPLARLVVARAQLLGRADARDADPLAAVERLHEERVADVLADRLEVERRVVALGGRLEALGSSGGTLCGISHVSGTRIPSRISAQYAECFSIAWNVNGLFSR